MSDAISADSKLRFPVMSEPNFRVLSFKNSPFQNCNVKDLVDNGLYYTGIDNELKCFWCCGLLNYSTRDCDFIKKHQEKYPECKFSIESKRFYSRKNETNLKQFSKGIDKKIQTNFTLDEKGICCGICLIREKEICFQNCNHIYSCETCSEKMENCPICREPIKERKRIYIH